MTKINLLPWREQKRKQQQQDFVAIIILAILVTGIILFGVYSYINGLQQYQQRRNQILKDEIARVDKKIKEIRDIEAKKNKLLTKIEVIQKLQESRPQIVHLFDELPRITPDGVYLTKFVQSGTALSINGKAQSNARVSAFMRAIAKSTWLHSPKLGVIKGQGNKTGGLNDFSMIAVQGYNEVLEAQ